MGGSPPLFHACNLLGGLSCTHRVCSRCRDEKSENMAHADVDEKRAYGSLDMKLKVLVKSSLAVLLVSAIKIPIHAIKMDKFMIKTVENMT